MNWGTLTEGIFLLIILFGFFALLMGGLTKMLKVYLCLGFFIFIITVFGFLIEFGGFLFRLAFLT